MQPNTPTPQKQVMDITAPPRQVAPSTPQDTDNPSLSVHAAPAVTEEDQPKAESNLESSTNRQEPAIDDTPVDEQQPRQPKKTQPVPTMAITLAVFAMAGLSVIAIMIYLNS